MNQVFMCGKDSFSYSWGKITEGGKYSWASQWLDAQKETTKENLEPPQVADVGVRTTGIDGQ